MRPVRYAALSLAVVVLYPYAAYGQPAFTDVTAGDLLTDVRSWGASWVDADGDGDLDLFVSRLGTVGGNELFVNTAGAFARLTGTPLTDDNSIGHSWADYDNDGDLDVLLAGNPSALYRNDGALTFTRIDDGPLAPSEANRGWSSAWGDYDGDGFVDVVIAHPAGFVGASQPNHFFHNDGDGAFTRVTDTPITDGLDPYTVPSWSDYDLDGDLDLFIGSGPANGSLAPDNLYANDGGTFTRITTAPIATDPRDGQVMNWIDYDNDGDLDLFVTNFSNTPNDFYRNDGSAYTRLEGVPLVTDVTGASLANTWGDLDNDGDLDVIVANGRTGAPDGQNNLYLNNGDGTFARVTGTPFTTLQESTSGATLGDFDGDGDLDLATTSPSAGTPRIRLWRNDTAPGNGWLKLNLVGIASNRAAIGAKVRATATIGGSAVTQFREVSAQNTFNGQNTLTVHVGLGDAATVSMLEITWPSGAVDTFDDVPTNTFFEVTEGGELVAVASEPTEAELTFGLAASFPNPFAERTTIPYRLDRAGPVSLAVYDLLGRRVRTLVDATRPAGSHTATWDGRDASGRRLSAGVYVCRLEAGEQAETRRLVLVR